MEAHGCTESCGSRSRNPQKNSICESQRCLLSALIVLDKLFRQIFDSRSVGAASLFVACFCSPDAMPSAFTWADLCKLLKSGMLHVSSGATAIVHPQGCFKLSLLLLYLSCLKKTSNEHFSNLVQNRRKRCSFIRRE